MADAFSGGVLRPVDEMKLPLLAVILAIPLGYALGGRLRNLSELRIRWAPMALLGLAMQMAPLPSDLEQLGLPLLILSFVPLGLFAGANVRLPGAALLLIGLLMNFAVISANAGMPVSRHALIASGQPETLTMLIEQGGVRHHLATQKDVLLPLGDVIPVGGFVRKAVSAGDLAAYAGAAWILAAGMRTTRRTDDASSMPVGPRVEAVAP